MNNIGEIPPKDIFLLSPISIFPTPISFTFDEFDQMTTACDDSHARDSLESALRELERSQQELKNVILLADNTLSNLYQQEQIYSAQYHAATDRYKKVLTVSEKICDACWEALPALGKNWEQDGNGDISVAGSSSNSCYTPATDGKQSKCLECGLPICEVALRDDIETAFILPQLSLDSLVNAAQTVENARLALSGHCSIASLMHQQFKQDDLRTAAWSDRSIYPPYIDHSWINNETSMISQDYYGRGSQAHGIDGTINNNQYGRRMTTSAKIECIGKVLQYKTNAELHFCRVQEAISEWIKFKDQHTEQLHRVNSAFMDVQVRLRQILHEKLIELDQLDDKIANVSNNECPICLQKPKRIVFQCGHQCCETCSPAIVQCHSCRAKITQRITMYG